MSIFISAGEKDPKDPKQCPWCLKDDACNYIFACGLPSGGQAFVLGAGCGRSWCWECSKKFCGIYIDPTTGVKTKEAKENHDAVCCLAESGFSRETYCGGGHNSHCGPRW